MEEQETKIETPVEEESDFADEVKPVEVPVEEKKKEEAPKEENGINLHKEEEDITPVEEERPAPEEKPVEGLKTDEKKGKKGKPVITYEYKDPLLQEIETERVAFFKQYRKFNLIKWGVTALCLVLIILGWIIPTFVPALKEKANVTIFVTLGTIVVAIALLAVFSFLFKKKTEKLTAAYFKKYYDCNDKYVFGDEISEKQGDVDNKLSDTLFNDSNLYRNVFKVGSRNCISFNRGGKNYTFADAAAQIRGQKVLQTVFVGKFLVTNNDWTGGDMIIYFKGNDRALPPTTLDAYEVFEDKKDLVIYGNGNIKKLLSKEVREAIKEIRTNKTLVDLSISVRAGRTFVGMGYEDNLMILPMDKPFNPAPTEQHKEDIAKLFALLDALDAAMAR